MSKAGGNARHRHISVQWKLFLALMLFLVLLLLVVWVVQIRLLGFFYEREKASELNDLARDVREIVDTDDFREAVENLGKTNLACIRVFRVQTGGLEEIGGAETIMGCLIHPMKAEVLQTVYEQTVENGGSYIKRVEFAGDDREKDDFRFPGFRHSGNVENMIYASVFTANEKEYFVMLDTELNPVSAVINTLQVQFLWISGAMLLLAFLLTFVLSRVIARPLKDITIKAGQLAKGNYEADFRGKGYREVEELADALNFAADEIGKTDSLQKELIANVSHDLRTPLTMIRGYSEMMRDIPGENSPENIQVIIDETSRLSELVNDLMDLSKLQAGTVKPDRTRFDLTEVLGEALRRYEALMRPKGYRVEYRLAEREATVVADRTMLLQVLYNLMNNAANYTGDDLLITVTEEIIADRVRVSVRDTGEGIAPELIPQIWDRYYRVDKVHKRAVMGTGLGLSIVKGVLEKHGALYGVDSAVGVGSVFWFELPLAPSEPPETGA